MRKIELYCENCGDYRNFRLDSYTDFDHATTVLKVFIKTSVCGTCKEEYKEKEIFEMNLLKELSSGNMCEHNEEIIVGALDKRNGSDYYVFDFAFLEEDYTVDDCFLEMDFTVDVVNMKTFKNAQFSFTQTINFEDDFELNCAYLEEN